jgi:cytochrome bd-type quinol oxidase subunit 2
MRLSRLRQGERLALAGAIALAVLLGLNWFFLSTPEAVIGQHESGIRSLGWFAVFLLLVVIGLALANAFFTTTQRATAMPIVLSVLTFAIGVLALLVVLLRLLVWQPHLGVDAGRADVDIELWGYLGLLATAAIAAGGWISILDERTDSAEAKDQTDEALRARGDNPRKPPPVTAAPRSGPADALADPANP